MSRRPPAPGARPAAADPTTPVRPGPRPARRNRPAPAPPARPERRNRQPRRPEPVPEPAPRAISVRTLFLGLVLLVAFVVLAPTLRAFISQSEQQRRVEAQYAAMESDVERLERDLARWDDPAYVRSQARERLGFVMPGEVAYRVVDPQTVEPEPEEGAGYEGLVEAEAGGPAPPWYLKVWASVVQAGEPPATDRGVPVPEPELFLEPDPGGPTP